MIFGLALAWVRECFHGDELLGIWRSVYGPGPWSVYVRRDDGRVMEVWSVQDTSALTFTGKIVDPARFAEALAVGIDGNRKEV